MGHVLDFYPIRQTKSIHKDDYYINDLKLTRDQKSREWGSNPRPTHYECVALPTELSRQKNSKKCLTQMSF